MLSITNSVITTAPQPTAARVPARPTTPSAGFALRIELAPIVDVAGLMRAVMATGADVRAMSTADDGSRVMTVNCTGIGQQDAVRAAIGTTPGARARSIEDATFAMHRGGKLRVAPKAPIAGPDELAMAYTPGVGRVSAAIAADPSLSWTFTGRSNTVAVLTDGSAVLGLGNIGPEAAMPVMEGKAALFHQFAGIDAYPIC
ncbi:MAG TPA: hypothetical protein PLV68_21365, partial [Ilumatobacteraceae bacterium]|nr:hypothetical protein [Ilumatobacteraceae bacterium]